MYGNQLNSYSQSGVTGRMSADAIPVTSTPGYAEINVSLDSIPTSTVYICPNYTGSDELVVHPNGITSSVTTSSGDPYYRDACLSLTKNNLSSYAIVV